jgi:hypothetical protein
LSGWFWRFGPALAFWDGGYYLAGGHTTCQVAKATRLEGSVGAEGHLDRLFTKNNRTV